MVLEDRTAQSNNKMAGTKVITTKFDDEDEQPPKKRLKRKNSSTPETEFEPKRNPSVKRRPTTRTTIPDSEDDTDDDVGEAIYRPTDLENALPPVDTDKDAIAKYESLRFEEEIPEDLKARLNQRAWVTGKSSIYVDAFNLALGTVLEDEGHLFDEKEMEVFQQWQDLDYEAQYLYESSLATGPNSSR